MINNETRFFVSNIICTIISFLNEQLRKFEMKTKDILILNTFIKLSFKDQINKIPLLKIYFLLQFFCQQGSLS